MKTNPKIQRQNFRAMDAHHKRMTTPVRVLPKSIVRHLKREAKMRAESLRRRDRTRPVEERPDRPVDQIMRWASAGLDASPTFSARKNPTHNVDKAWRAI